MAHGPQTRVNADYVTRRDSQERLALHTHMDITQALDRALNPTLRKL